MDKEEFSETLNKLKEIYNEIIVTFKEKRYVEYNEISICRPDFTELSVFSAKLFSFLFRTCGICDDISLSDDEEMYPEFEENIGQDIAGIFVSKAEEYFSKIERKADLGTVFWQSFESFTSFVLNSHELYSITMDLEPVSIPQDFGKDILAAGERLSEVRAGLLTEEEDLIKKAKLYKEKKEKEREIENVTKLIRSLQQMTVYIFVACLHGGQANRSCFAYAPACWVEVFYNKYNTEFYKQGNWTLWSKYRKVTDGAIPNEINELCWSDALVNARSLCQKILHSSTLQKRVVKCENLIEKEPSVDGQNSQNRLERLSVMHQTLMNSLKNTGDLTTYTDKEGESPELEIGPLVPMQSLWNDYGSEYINLHIFARALFKRLIKMCGLSSLEEASLKKQTDVEEVIVDNSLQDAVESVAKATILMLIYQKSEDLELYVSFRKNCRNFSDVEAMRNRFWLFVADACDHAFIKTTILCLNVLQMTGFVFEMISRGFSPFLYDHGYEIWVKVFLLKFGREYSRRGGWVLFLRDALPTIETYATPDFSPIRKDYVELVKGKRWEEFISLFVQRHGAVSLCKPSHVLLSQLTEHAPGKYGQSSENSEGNPDQSSSDFQLVSTSKTSGKHLSDTVADSREMIQSKKPKMELESIDSTAPIKDVVRNLTDIVAKTCGRESGSEILLKKPRSDVQSSSETTEVLPEAVTSKSETMVEESTRKMRDREKSSPKQKKESEILKSMRKTVQLGEKTAAKISPEKAELDAEVLKNSRKTPS